MHPAVSETIGQLLAAEPELEWQCLHCFIIKKAAELGFDLANPLELDILLRGLWRWHAYAIRQLVTMDWLYVSAADVYALAHVLSLDPDDLARLQYLNQRNAAMSRKLPRGGLVVAKMCRQPPVWLSWLSSVHLNLPRS